jgi:hypothetical protein
MPVIPHLGMGGLTYYTMVAGQNLYDTVVPPIEYIRGGPVHVEGLDSI